MSRSTKPTADNQHHHLTAGAASTAGDITNASSGIARSLWGGDASTMSKTTAAETTVEAATATKRSFADENGARRVKGAREPRQEMIHGGANDGSYQMGSNNSFYHLS